LERTDLSAVGTRSTGEAPIALSLLDRRAAAELKKVGALTEEAACQITLGSAAVGVIDDAITEVIAIDVYFHTEGGRIAQTPARILCAIVDLHRDGNGYDLIIGDEHIAEYNLLTFMQDPDAWTSIREVSNYAFVYPRTSDFELGAKFESGVETEILVRVGLELPLDQNSF